MRQAFWGASNLIMESTAGKPDMSEVTDMAFMFQNATKFNGDISMWSTEKVTTMQGMFSGATDFNQDIGGWDVAQVTNMGSMFARVAKFKGDISRWNTEKVTTMSSMFSGATDFNQDIGGWNTSAVENMASMFDGAADFDKNIGRWDVGKVTTMSYMFSRVMTFNQDIGGWNTASVTNMSGMFDKATSFNQDIGGWNVEKVTTMQDMFDGATSFNQDIGRWNVEKVTTMKDMFKGATSFNQDIGGWNVGKVTNMKDMFYQATSFNQDIGGWNVEKVTDMARMFYQVTSFNQDIGRWNVEKVTTMSQMFEGATLSPTNYDALLTGWNAKNLTPRVTFHGGASKYSLNAAQTAKDNMVATIANGGDNWDITDGGRVQAGDAPTAIFLSSTSIAENAGTNAPVGTISTDGGASSYTYTLVAGTGDTDNASFDISGTELQLIASADYETQPSYSIRIKASGGENDLEKSFNISVNDITKLSVIGDRTLSVAEGNTAVIALRVATDPLLQTISFLTTLSGDDASLFTLTTAGVLTFSAAPDYESPADVGRNNVHEVTVTATDGQTPAKMATQTLTITVTDVNEHTPAFASTETMVDVAEGTTVATTVTAMDADAGQTITLVLSGVDESKFSISQAGELIFNTVPDHESAADTNGDNVYEVTITATDDGTPAKMVTQDLTITVTDVVNEHAPAFTSVATKNVAEGTTAVTTVTATDADDPGQPVSFTLTGGDDDSKFTLTPAGVLTFSAEPDFENPADMDADNEYEVTVTATDNGTPVMTATQTLTITVTGVNEAPVFAGGAIATVSYAESATTAVTRVSATDDDAGQTVSFSLTGGADAGQFSITASGELTFENVPDFESPADMDADNVYEVTVTATDNGTPVMIATQTLTITVTDVNEHAPVFEGEATATVSYAENGTTVVATVDVTDGDTKQTITLTLSGDDMGQFAITPEGVLTFKTAPNFEIPTDTGLDNVYEVTITATDNGMPAEMATQTLTITVTDVNEHAPVFAGGATAIASYAENATTAIAINVTDGDTKQTITLMLSGADESKFTLTPEGELTFNTAPDFEMPTDMGGNSVYEVTITATDNGTPVMTATQILTITVTDVNEHAPVFEGEATATVSYAENGTTVVTTVDVTDGDTKQTITLTLSGADESKFSISQAGELTFNTAPDFEMATDMETDNMYEVTITATDNGMPAEMATQTLTITVTDVNEHAPVFASAATPIDYPENASATVTTVDVTDGDTKQTITLTLSGADESKFSISQAGELTFKTAPDYENPANTNNVYVVTVTATDNGTPEMTATQTLTITVTDVANENAPVFTGGATATVSYAENGTTTVTTVATTDMDSEQTVSFTLTGGDDDSKFTLTPAGVLTFNAVPDFESPADMDADNVYEVTVTATDGQTLPMTATQTLTITVTDVNEHAPVFTSGATVTYAENATTAVTTVGATDTDAGQTVTFTLTGGADVGLFSITPAGVLTFNVAPDFEMPTDTGMNNVYEVTIMATDNGTPAMTAMQALTITVTDVENEHAPVFTSEMTVDVAEGTTAVTTVTATDTDAGQTVTFLSTLSGADAGLFTITPAGVLTFNTAPDYEVPTDMGTDNVYEVTIMATDGQTPPMTATQTLTITVTDVENEHAPVFTSEVTMDVAEGTTAVTTVIATDADAGQTVSFFLTGEADEDMFSITSAGELTFNMAPDYEVPTDMGTDNVYEVTITATDNGTPAMTAMQALTITVTDVDEKVGTNPPLGLEAFTGIEVYPNPAGAVLHISGVEGHARYTLSGIDGKVLKRGKLEASTADHSVALPSLKQGIYLLQITTGKGSITRKIVKE